MPVIAAVALLVMLGIVLYAMQTTVMLEDAQSTTEPSEPESSEPESPEPESPEPSD